MLCRDLRLAYHTESEGQLSADSELEPVEFPSDPKERDHPGQHNTFIMFGRGSVRIFTRVKQPGKELLLPVQKDIAKVQHYNHTVSLGTPSGFQFWVFVRKKLELVHLKQIEMLGKRFPDCFSQLWETIKKLLCCSSLRLQS